MGRKKKIVPGSTSTELPPSIEHPLKEAGEIGGREIPTSPASRLEALVQQVEAYAGMPRTAIRAFIEGAGALPGRARYNIMRGQDRIPPTLSQADFELILQEIMK